MRSMTGFGSGSAPLGSGKLAVEIRALNHRHQEVRVRLPAELQEFAFFLEQSAREHLGRGRFDVSVRVDGSLGTHAIVNETRLKQVYGALSRLAKELDPDATVDIAQLMLLPDMVTLPALPLEESRQALFAALEDAGRALFAMQEVEGRTLHAELSGRVSTLVQLCEHIAAGALDFVEHRRQKLKERLDQMLAELSPVPQDRLEHEIALLADRSDITEEVVRLQSHFSQFSDFMQEPGEVGRRLDFLLQEIAREVNTIGAKQPHTKVAQLIVEMKSEVERLREQVQNVA